MLIQDWNTHTCPLENRVLVNPLVGRETISRSFGPNQSDSSFPSKQVEQNSYLARTVLTRQAEDGDTVWIANLGVSDLTGFPLPGFCIKKNLICSWGVEEAHWRRRDV